MEIRKTLLCSSTKEHVPPTIRLGGRGRPTIVDRSLKSRLRALWRKLTRERIRIFDCSTVHDTPVHLHGYDAYTYAQNFDQGLLMMCGDNDVDALSRSFSMRFAAPRKLLQDDDISKRSYSDVGENNKNNHDVLICFLEGKQ
ncbi:hypothetical protein vseg_016379 [Gypsophila vaccaria]